MGDTIDSVLKRERLEQCKISIEASYSNNRYSQVYVRDHSITVWSGKYPAFIRFQADIQEYLTEHDLVMVRTNTDVPKKVDGESERVHWIKAKPVEDVL